MLSAISADSARIEGVTTVVAVDSMSGSDCSLTDAESVSEQDWTLLIAPESGGALAALSRDVERVGGRLLGPSSQFIELTSDKHRTAERLRSAGVPAPFGFLLPAAAPLPREFDYPAVLKPCDGAGSQDTWLVESAPATCGDVRLPHNRRLRRLERFCPGTAASVAVLCGPAGLTPLMPCSQRLSGDGRFQYLGGALPLDNDLAARATDLAVRALRTLPAARGYVGVDMVLGDDPSGSGDVVVEVNPRLTTSYVGLRALCHQNLALAMIEIASGSRFDLSWRAGRVEFDPIGQVTIVDKPPAAFSETRMPR